MVKVVSSSLCASNLSQRLKKVLFLAVSPDGLFLWQCRQVLVSGCIARCCFISGSWSWLSWLCDQWIVLDGNNHTAECNCDPAEFYSWRFAILVSKVGYHLLTSHSKPTGYNVEGYNKFLFATEYSFIFHSFSSLLFFVLVKF